MHTRTRLSAATAAAVAATLTPTPVAAADAHRVSDTWMISDSMGVRGYFPYLHDRRPAWYVDAVGGRPVSDLPARFDFMRDRVGFPDNVVLALGTNPPTTGTWTKASYEGVVGQVPATSNVYLVTGYRGPKWGGHKFVTRTARWMRQIARANDHVYLIDWRKHVVRGKVRLADGIHAQRGAGERYWARLIDRRVTRVSNR